MEDLVMFGGMYAGRRVFITGHTGFKGAWLTRWLCRLGAEVTGYALSPPSEPNLFDAMQLGQSMTHLSADVRDTERMTIEMTRAKPSVVFHLAAQPLVRIAYAEPVETFATNVMGTVNVLEAARACDSVEAVVIVTSDKCYRNRESGQAFSEDDPMGGRDPYSASKGCAELVTAAYRDSFFGAAGSASVASVRAGNVIGGGDWATDRIIPDCVRALTDDRPVLVRSPEAVRPWQHVLEPLSGYLHLAVSMLRDRGSFAGPWNFGPTDSDGVRTVSWVVKRFLDAWGTGSWTTPRPQDGQPHEAHLLSLDSSKALERLGWAPVWEASAAVRRTAAWYRSYYDDRPAADLVDGDLRDYEVAAYARGLAWATDLEESAESMR